MEAGTIAQTDGYRSRAVARTAYRSLSRSDRVSPDIAMDTPRGGVSTSGLIAKVWVNRGGTAGSPVLNARAGFLLSACEQVKPVDQTVYVKH